ncbi:MAG: bifunctional (p)ppGpp synthetase/guanosine-3',5'-bis(diphosphate) 3'-pyrophosphohydrolase [Acholeplasmatales bacterium]|jgi:GTP pyrophosphokinase|nr:bifunctional (p)ppGpp synthetase/guanosine-3',5'-bis(diphosphate) 3'-pyrophosphohydrolase [Acholeplasmatales bacterium]MCI9653187.1 bifunctional (p)ppGpp synthetase/guanosine-3',5'-bis(diphosphate) 3'-pyrophosphohydrolase [Acholeplasmatales bacterium]
MQVSYDDLYQLISKYIVSEENQSLIYRAYDLANRLHVGQVRQTGEPYIIHPIHVAIILAELHAGPATICAGLLHDTVEDTSETKEDLIKAFGEDIASIVEGVTKLSQMKFATLEQKQAENHQHMLIAMAKDIRVIIVKLADRLHNIRTLGALPSEKQVRIAKETLEIYAPLAHKLGMFQIKAELEDKALKYVEPVWYAKIISQIKNNSSVRMHSIDHTISEIKDYLKPEQIPQFEIKGRIKNVYSIYKKMINQNKSFEDIYDILAIRIIVNTIGECYQALGIIHAHYTPVPKRFKDYIAVPKPNMYQSLHTTVISNDGLIFEVQIRTEEMDRVAELGIAAHWAYKENVEYSKEKEQFEIASKLKWYRELLEYSEEDKSTKAKDFVETIKEDILTANVYVYTPTGEVIALPKGATPLDFAYKIHTNIGNKTVGALVNQKIVPLDYELQNGDIISIKTSKNSFGPSENWLKIAKTSHAKHKIKGFLNKQNRDVLVANGKASLEEEFRINKLSFDVDDAFVEAQFSKNNMHSLEDLYYEIGKGNFSVKTVTNRLSDKNAHEESLAKQMERSKRILTTNSETGVVVEGLSNPQLKLGSCCNPIPGDPIMGYVTKGYGIVIHHKNCKNAISFAKERLIHLNWATNPNRKYPVCIKITATSNPNLLVEIMNVVSANGLSILAINANNNQNLQTVVKLKVLTNGLNDLEKMIVNMKKIKYIDHIERDNL